MYSTGPVRMQAGAFVVVIWPLGLCTVVAGRMRGGLCGEVKDRQTSSSVWGCLNEYIRFTESSRAPRPADTVWEWRSWAMWSDGVCDAFRRGSPTLDSRNTLAHTPKKIPDPVETSSKQTWQIMLQQESSGYQQVAMLSSSSLHLHPPTEKPVKATGDNCQFLYFPFISIPMTRQKLTHLPFTFLSHMDGPKVEPTLQAPVHQSSKCRGPRGPLSPLIP